MGIREERPPGGQAIDMGRFHLRVAPETAEPVVLIVDGDEQDIGLFGPQGLNADKTEPEYQKENENTVHRGTPLCGPIGDWHIFYPSAGGATMVRWEPGRRSSSRHCSPERE